MSQKTAVQVFAPIFILAVLAVVVVGLIRPATNIQFDSLSSRSNPQSSFDSEAASELLAYRWQAMANFYNDNDLLTRNSFDSGAAAELSAYRWQAMADYYEDNDLLTRSSFDSGAAAELSAYRWQAMADFYKDNELLTRNTVDSEAAVSPASNGLSERVVHSFNSEQMSNERYLARLATGQALQLPASDARFARIVRNFNHT